MSLQAKKDYDAITLLAPGAVTETSAGTTPARLPGMINSVAFTLVVSAAATDVGDTLDVYVQTKLDGSNWTDVVHFTQVLGSGGAKRFVAKVSADVAEAMFAAGTALAAGSVRNLIGDEWRVRYDITDASTDNASFTIGVYACPM